MKRILILLSLLFLQLLSFSQSNKIDSLKQMLDRPDDSVKVEILISIFDHYEKGVIKESKIYLDDALKIARDIGIKPLESKALLRMGKYYIITGAYENAIEINEKAKAFNEENNFQKGVGSSYMNLGVTYEKMGRYNEAMDNLIKALNIYESLSDSQLIAKTYLNLGLLYSKQQEYEKSLELYKKSLEIREEVNDKEGIALLYNNMAIVNYYLENYDNVRSYFEKAYQMYVELGNLRKQIMALSNLAEIHNIIGQKEKALNKYFEILELEKQIGEKGELVKTYALIADIYRSRGNLEEAEKHFKESLYLAKEIGALPEISGAYLILSDIYKSKKDYKKALEYFENYNLINDSIYSLEKAKQIKEIETQYETKKKEQQIINLENQQIISDLKIKRQKSFSIFLLTGIASILLFLLVLFSKNKKIRRANKLLAYQKKQITDSIEYASRIQTAILPPGDYISSVIPDHFILYKPRDIVSGDFYWIAHKHGKIIVAVVDCTGHGVPGAFMSMLGFAFLNEIVNKETELKANIILNQLRDNVKKSLHQTGKDDEAKDGMDIALCIIDPKHKKLQYSGAYNPLCIARNDELISLKADRMPIGIHIIEKESFTNHEMDIKEGDIIYVFTDGYIDQFGGTKSGKLKIGPFKELLMSVKDKPMKEQKKILDHEFNQWKGNRDQIDDVLVMGIKI